MKKIFLLIFTFSVVICFSQDSTKVYKLEFKSLNNQNIKMSDLQGKQIVIVEFDALNPDRQQLLSLDSLSKQNDTAIGVIAIPVQHSGDEVNKNNLKKLLQDTLRLSFIISDIGFAKKSSQSKQHPILKWATHVGLNKHFNNDVSEDGEIFVFSRTGILYARLGRLTGIGGGVMQRVLKDQPLTD
jgi:glutathione peroxidase-family protein